MTLLRSAVRAIAAEIPAAWRTATAVVGGIAIALLALGVIRATEPLGALLLQLAQGGH